MAIAIAFGVLIGASLGLLGGGGSVLTVPIFVYALGFGPKEAIAMSLAVVGVTSLVGAMGHWRAGNVNVRLGAVFGAVAMVGSYLGTRLASFVAGSVQLVIFGAVMLVAATFMFRGSRGQMASPVGEGAVQGGFLTVGLEGLAVGVLTGLVGVGGGFLIVPALVLLGVPIKKAVGTSLLIISANCAVGVYGYLGRVPFTWSSVVLVTGGTLPGIAAGTYLHRFTSQEVLRRAFAVFLIVVAIFILYQNLATVLSAPGGSSS